MSKRATVNALCDIAVSEALIYEVFGDIVYSGLVRKCRAHGVELQDFHRKYKNQMSMAHRRGIGFFLSFAEWMKVWEDSGKLFSRGTRKDEYVMCRLHDKGNYELGNVRIDTAPNNIKEYWADRKAERKSNAKKLRK